MVAIKAHQAEAFMKSPPPRLAAALFFGSDPGLVSERSAVLARTLADRENPPGEILRLDDTELDEDPGRLETELQMRPMFSSRRIVRATAGRRVSTQLLKPLLAAPLEGLLIVESPADDVFAVVRLAVPHPAMRERFAEAVAGLDCGNMEE